MKTIPLESVVSAFVFLMFFLSVGLFLVASVRKRAFTPREAALLAEDPKRSLKSMYPAGLFLSQTFSPLRYIPQGLRRKILNHENHVRAKLDELYGLASASPSSAQKDEPRQQTNLEAAVSLHCAQRWSYSMLAALICSVLAVMLFLTGDTLSAFILALAALAGACVMPFLADQELDKKIEKRRESIQVQFPEFLNQLVLLVNAGASIERAWTLIVSKNNSDTPLYRELRACQREVNNGVAREEAYDHFARRCKIRAVIKSMAVIILNLKLGGGKEVAYALRAEADDCWELRKATARRMGEKASSKLMIPMAIMLFGIILIVALPAVLTIMNVGM